MRVEQGKGEKGSLKWVQVLINEHPEVLNNYITSSFKWKMDDDIEWRSPKKQDNYAEYRDLSFINLLNLELHERSLDRFWPSLGPQWDALGKSKNGVLLVEAKANIPEFISPASGASKQSLELIKASLTEVQQYLEINPKYDWSQKFYQYTNRIAHLYFLHVVNKIPSFLVFIDFIGAIEVNGPKYAEEWKAATMVAENILGLPKTHKLSKWMTHVYIDVKDIGGTD